MFFFKSTAIALMASAIGSLAMPVVKVHPGNKGDIIITKENTVNATNPAPTHQNFANTEANGGRLPLALVNNLNGGAVNAYVTGLDSNNRLVMLQPDGTFYYPSADPSQTTPQPVNANVAIPLGAQGSTTNIAIPSYISAARIWFAEGTLMFYTVYNSATGGPSLVEPSAVNPSDPSAGVNWGFVELTNNDTGGLYANISYVDFVGLILGMQLNSADGSTQTAKGLQSTAVSSICNELKQQSSVDGQPWGNLCQVNSAGQPLRVLAPFDYASANNGAFSNFWTQHVDDVWSHYTSNVLTINTQAQAGSVSCQVSGDTLNCAGDNRGYAKPTAGDIFGCNSGPFAIAGDDNDVHRAVVPRLCAAFHRGTLLQSGGNTQPGPAASTYYTSTPSNWYSKFVHQYEVDGRGYAFAYDDVNPAVGVDQSGVVANPNPSLLTVTVGGPSS